MKKKKKRRNRRANPNPSSCRELRSIINRNFASPLERSWKGRNNWYLRGSPFKILRDASRNLGSYDPYVKVVRCSLHFSYEKRSKGSLCSDREKRGRKPHRVSETERRRGERLGSESFRDLHGFFQTRKIRSLDASATFKWFLVVTKLWRKNLKLIIFVEIFFFYCWDVKNSYLTFSLFKTLFQLLFKRVKEKEIG